MRNYFVIQETNVPLKTIDSGAYMRNLSKKEYLAILLSEVARFYRFRQDYVKALRLIDMGLKAFPNEITS